MKPWILISFLLVSAGWAGAESFQSAETDFKSDLCAECKMAVTSRSYAAQIATGDMPLFFDDIGCLVQYERQGKIPADSVHARFVRTVAGDAWVEVTQAVWVSTRDVRTPMGYGLHAFADPASAEAFAKKQPGAQIVTWKQVPDLVPARTGMGMGKM